MAQASRTKPEAGRDDGAHDKSLSSMVAKHTRDISFWPSEDDFEQMAATRLGCKTPAEAYSKTGMIDETMRLAKQVRTLPSSLGHCAHTLLQATTMHHPLPSCSLHGRSLWRVHRRELCGRESNEGAIERAGKGYRPQGLQSFGGCRLQGGILQVLPSDLQGEKGKASARP